MTDTLPLWPIAPNWVDPVVERLEFRTAVMSGILGHEQRQAVRYRPRRTIEATFTPFESERAFAMLALQRKGAEQWRVPLWFDSARLTAGASAGATVLYFDTTGREYRAGDFAYLVGPDAFSGERVEVLDVFPDRITLVDGTTRAWGKGAQIHPCRRAWIDAGEWGNVTSRAAQFSARFDIDTDSDYEPGVGTIQIYQGQPLLAHRPNWAEQLTLAYEQQFQEFDPGTGPRVRFAPADRAFSVTRYALLLHGAAEIAEYRALMYHLRGQQRSVWVPTYGHDLIVAAPAVSGGSVIDVSRVGLGDLGGITPDIADVIIGRDLPVRFSNLGAAPSTEQERLLLVSPLPRDVAAGEAVSLLSLARLEQDVIAINHITDGIAKTTLAWKAFTDGRDGSAAGVLPIPIAEMNSTPCGVQERFMTITITMPDPIPTDGITSGGLLAQFNVYFRFLLFINGVSHTYSPLLPYGIDITGGVPSPTSGTVEDLSGNGGSLLYYEFSPGLLTLWFNEPVVPGVNGFDEYSALEVSMAAGGSFAGFDTKVTYENTFEATPDNSNYWPGIPEWGFYHYYLLSEYYPVN